MRYPGSPFGDFTETQSGGAGEFGEAHELTLNASGVAAGSSTYKNLLIDTYGDAASDTMTSLTGYSEGEEVKVRAAHTDRTVVVQDGSNFNLQGVDFSLSNTEKLLVLLNIGSDKWVEQSRAGN